VGRSRRPDAGPIKPPSVVPLATLVVAHIFRPKCHGNGRFSIRIGQSRKLERTKTRKNRRPEKHGARPHADLCPAPFRYFVLSRFRDEFRDSDLDSPIMMLECRETARFRPVGSVDTARGASACRYPHFRPVGTHDNSPAVHCWGARTPFLPEKSRRDGRKRTMQFNRPYGTAMTITPPPQR
jgi:hypothetical protein